MCCIVVYIGAFGVAILIIQGLRTRTVYPEIKDGDIII